MALPSLRLGVQEPNAKAQRRQAPPDAIPILSRAGETSHEAAWRQTDSPVVVPFDRVELGKNPWKNPAEKS